VSFLNLPALLSALYGLPSPLFTQAWDLFCPSSVPAMFFLKGLHPDPVLLQL
jgi:hypothetical protein